MLASGSRATISWRSSASTRLFSDISSRVERGIAIVWSIGPMAATSTSASAPATDCTARAAPTRSASTASICAMSMRRASSEDATSPESQPVSHVRGRCSAGPTSTVSAVIARCAIPARWAACS